MPLGHLEPRQLSRYSDKLRARTVGVRFPTGERVFFLFHSVQTGSGAHSVFNAMDTGGFFPREKAVGV
jgi:hypothetical protein